MSTVLHAIVLIALLLAIPRDAFAYLDPGSGSMLLQALLAGVAGLLVLLRLYWRRIKALFNSKKVEAQSKNTDDNSNS